MDYRNITVDDVRMVVGFESERNFGEFSVWIETVLIGAQETYHIISKAHEKDIEARLCEELDLAWEASQ